MSLIKQQKLLINLGMWAHIFLISCVMELRYMHEILLLHIKHVVSRKKKITYAAVWITRWTNHFFSGISGFFWTKTTTTTMIDKLDLFILGYWAEIFLGGEWSILPLGRDRGWAGERENKTKQNIKTVYVASEKM